MAYPQEALFKTVLRQHNRDTLIYRAVMGGWIDYQASSEFGRWKRKGTRASIVWERIIDRALADFDQAGGVHIKEENDTVSFLFDEQILLRFKKGDANKLSRNYPTQLALAYHKPKHDLFGFEGIQRAEIIYVLNERETEIESVSIVAREQDKILWEFELVGAAETIEALPMTPQHPVPSKKRLVRLKGDTEKEVKKKASGDESE